MKALIKNFLAGSFGKFATIFHRIFSVSLLLRSFTAEQYGIWVLLSSLPSWLSLANMGFGTVTGNAVTMAVARDDWITARKHYSNAIILVTTVVGSGLALVSLILTFCPANFFSSYRISENEVKWTLFFLSANVLVSFYCEIFGGRLRAAGKAYVVMSVNGFRPILEVAAIFLALTFLPSFALMAAGSFLVALLHIGVLFVLGSRALPALGFNFSLLNSTTIREIWQKGFAFTAFPLGNALLFQGNILVVQWLLGPAFVALFSTARTLVRSVNQCMELLNQVVWPELTILLGSGQFSRAARLHRLSVSVSLLSALAVVGLLILWGRTLFAHWTDSILTLSPSLLLVFLIPIPFNALWFTSSVVHAACNEHEGLAKLYLAACLCSVVLGIVGILFFGIYGAALSSVVADIWLIHYVFCKSMRITHDNPRYFFRNLLADAKGVYAVLRNAVFKYFVR